MNFRLAFDWVRGRKHSWSTDASTMTLAGDRFCPGCRAPFSRFTVDLDAVKDGPEVVLWNGRCTCGADLTIYND